MNYQSTIVDSILLDYGFTPKDILLSYYQSSKTANNTSRLAFERLSKMPLTFLYDLAKGAKVSLTSLIKLFKNSKIVSFFSKIGWSLRRLFDLVKNGWRSWVELNKAVGEYLSKTKVGKWTQEELKKLDSWLSKHPKVKRIAGPVLAGMLIFFWFNMSFTGDPVFDFDMSSVLKALGGGFSLSEIFGGPDGMRFLLSVVLGLSIGVTFPWPGPASLKFVSAILYSLADKVGINLRRTKKTNDTDLQNQAR